MEASSYAERPDVLAYRVGENAKRLERLEGWRVDVDRERAAEGEREKTLTQEISELNHKMDGLIKLLVVSSLALAGSAITFAFSILAATGRIG